MGGMQVLEWAINYKDSVHLAIIIGSSVKQYPIGFVFDDISRRVIMSDPDWQNGNYYGRGQPRKGLSLARQIGHVTYLSEDTLERKFGRKKIPNRSNGKFAMEYEIQKYFDYKGKSFVSRFDANSFLYITHAIDDFDLTEGGRRNLRDVFKGVKAKFLLVSFTSDWLYSPEQVEEIYMGLAESGVSAVYRKLNLPYGHDAFLIYNNTLGNVLVDFLEDESREYFMRGKNRSNN
jgi:homoserine O-acetyltransferase